MISGLFRGMKLVKKSNWDKKVYKFNTDLSIVKTVVSSNDKRRFLSIKRVEKILNYKHLKMHLLDGF